MQFPTVPSTDDLLKKNIGVVAEFFFAKSTRGCFTPVIEKSLTPLVLNETSTQTYSLSEEGFGYNYGCFKSSASHVCC